MILKKVALCYAESIKFFIGMILCTFLLLLFTVELDPNPMLLQWFRRSGTATDSSILNAMLGSTLKFLLYLLGGYVLASLIPSFRLSKGTVQRGDTAVITGASMGIGEYIARELAMLGYDVVLVARSKDKLTRLADEIETQYGVTATVIVCDLTADNAVDELVRKIELKQIRVHTLVNNAGAGQTGRFADVDTARHDFVMRLNMTSVTQLTSKLLPSMLKNKRGRILTIGSSAGWVPGPNFAVYYASKAYVNSLFNALWWELCGTGVTSTLVCPGPVATPFAEDSGVGSTLLFKLFRPVSAQHVAKRAVDAMMRGERCCITEAPTKFNNLWFSVTPMAPLVGLSAFVTGN